MSDNNATKVLLIVGAILGSLSLLIIAMASNSKPNVIKLSGYPTPTATPSPDALVEATPVPTPPPEPTPVSTPEPTLPLR